MSQFQEDLAIVLRSQPFQERDKIVTMLTENQGRITGVAKGAIHSRRFGGSLDLFACSHIRWKETQGELVRVDDMRQAYWERRFTGARRVPINNSNQ